MAGDQKYDIVFRGKLARDFEQAQVQSNLARIFKTDESKIAALFTGERKVLKRGLDRETADKYRSALKNAGAVVAVVSAGRRQRAAGSTASEARQTPQAESPGVQPGTVDSPGDGQPADQGRASYQIDETPPDAEAGSEPEAQREVKAAYQGKASYQIDETPPEPEPEPEQQPVEPAYQGRASYQIDESDDEESAAGDAAEESGPEGDGSLDFEPVSKAADKAGRAAESAPATDGGEALEFESAADGDLSVESDYDVLDRQPPPAAPEIEVGNLSTDADYDALDDSDRPPPPDIEVGDLDVAEVGATVDDSERPPKREIDTSGLDMEADFDALVTPEKPPAPDIDISGLSLADDPD